MLVISASAGEESAVLREYNKSRFLATLDKEGKECVGTGVPPAQAERRSATALITTHSVPS